jgi:hypothetical protein
VNSLLNLRNSPYSKSPAITLPSIPGVVTGPTSTVDVLEEIEELKKSRKDSESSLDDFETGRGAVDHEDDELVGKLEM